MPEPVGGGIWDADRMTPEDLDKELGSFTGKERAYKAKNLGEDWGYTVGKEAGAKETQSGAIETLKAEHADAIKAVQEAAVKDVELALAANEAALIVVRAEGHLAGFDEGVASVGGPDSDTSEYDRGVADGLAKAEAAEEAEEEMVQCPGCNGTGNMIGWTGSQCKKCYGATKVKASSLVEEVETDG